LVASEVVSTESYLRICREESSKPEQYYTTVGSQFSFTQTVQFHSETETDMLEWDVKISGMKYSEKKKRMGHCFSM
jgi:hypothetical protein